MSAYIAPRASFASFAPVTVHPYFTFRAPASIHPDLVCSDDGSGVESFARVQSRIWGAWARYWFKEGQRDSRAYRIAVSRAGVWGKRATKIGE